MVGLPPYSVGFQLTGHSSSKSMSGPHGKPTRSPLFPGDSRPCYGNLAIVRIHASQCMGIIGVRCLTRGYRPYFFFFSFLLRGWATDQLQPNAGTNLVPNLLGEPYQNYRLLDPCGCAPTLIFLFSFFFFFLFFLLSFFPYPSWPLFILRAFLFGGSESSCLAS